MIRVRRNGWSACVAVVVALAVAMIVAPSPSGAPFSTAGVAVAANPPLSFDATGPSYATAGGEIVYKMVVTNSSSSRVTSIGVFVEVPDHTTFVRGGDFIAGDNGSEFYEAALGRGENVTYEFVVRVDDGVSAGTFIENNSFQIYTYDAGGAGGPTIFDDNGVVTAVELPGDLVASYKNDDARAFDVKVDGYGFENYGNEPPRVAGDDLSAADVFELFGPSACKQGTTAETCVLSGPATKWMEGELGSMGGGHCDGLAATSLRFFEDLPFRDRTDADDFQGGANTVNDLVVDQSIENYIAHYFVTQIFDEVWDSQVHGTPAELVEHLIAEFNKPDPVPYTVALFQNPGYKLGHAIAAYGVERVSNSESRILVYDNNFPNQRQYITVDTAADTWTYVTAATPGEPPFVYDGAATGDKSGGLWLVPLLSRERAAGEYFSCPFCNDTGAAAGAAAAPTARANNLAIDNEAAPGGLVAGDFQIRFAGEGAILVVDDEGRAVGDDPDSGVFRDEIPDSRVAPFMGGRNAAAPPAITVPFVEHDDARYQVIVHGKTAAAATGGSLTIVGDGFAIGVNHIDLDPDEVFTFTFSPDGDHLSFTSTETMEAPEIFVSHDPIHAGDPSVIFDVEGVTVHAGETISLDLDPELERMHFDDTGGEDEMFEIDMRLILPNGEVADYPEIIHVPAGATSAFVDFGAWDHLGHPPIYIDDVLTNPLVNHRLRLDELGGTYDATPAPNAPGGVFQSTATFSNVTEISLTDVSLEVLELGDGDVLLDADGGPSGVGATLSVPPATLGPDGILHPNESFTVEFDVGLANPTSSALLVDAKGVPHDWHHVDPPAPYDANNGPFSFAVNVGDLTCRGRPVTILGTAASETLVGSLGDDVIAGLGGDDAIDGRSGDDTICAGDGNDRVDAGDGDDWVDAGNGNDLVIGGADDDTLVGNSGNDEIFGGLGRDGLYGGSGDDTLLGQAGNDRARGGPGDDTINGGYGNDRLAGEAGDDDLDGAQGRRDVCDGGPQTTADTATGACETTINIP